MPDSSASSSSASPTISASHRLSALAPLAPLEYLQNQRRGSITDPSLHAAPSALKLHSAFRADHSVSPSSPRPNSPYVFGDATANHHPHHHHHHHHNYPSENTSGTSPHIRNLLRSPSLEPQARRPPTNDPHDPPSRSRLPAPQGLSSRDAPFHKLSIDTDRNGHHPRPSIHDSLPFDFNRRRHSIATGQHPHPHTNPPPPVLHGIKRKMSIDRAIFSPVGEETDSQLVGPGVPSVMEVDSEAPAPKRRGSAIDTQRIAQLSLNDRRGSTDSRSSIPWWNNERRDSTSSMLSNPSSTGGYSSGFTGGDSPHGRPPPSIAAFSWPNSQSSSNAGGTAGGDPSSATSQNGTDPNTPHVPRPFESGGGGPPSGNTIPPLSYLADRRMSVPDTLISPSNLAKGSRPISRPSSRQGYAVDPITRTNSGQDNPNSLGKKDANATPYSRSPELRVSHKLAERKRRKEMKDLFDELRDQLPADRGMKASKWEILTKAIDFVIQLKQSNQDMVREIDRLRQEVDMSRGSSGSFQSSGPPPPPSHVVYGQVPMTSSQGPPPPLLQPPLPGPGQLPLPRATQNTYPSITSHSSSAPNGGLHSHHEGGSRSS